MRFSRVILNGLTVAVYTFDAGEVLAVHDHKGKPGHEHVSIVARGEFVALVGDKEHPTEAMTLHAGDLVTWPLGAPHGFRAVTQDARIMNVRPSLDPAEELPPTRGHDFSVSTL